MGENKKLRFIHLNMYDMATIIPFVTILENFGENIDHILKVLFIDPKNDLYYTSFTNWEEKVGDGGARYLEAYYMGESNFWGVDKSSWQINVPMNHLFKFIRRTNEYN